MPSARRRRLQGAAVQRRLRFRCLHGLAPGTWAATMQWGLSMQNHLTDCSATAVWVPTNVGVGSLATGMKRRLFFDVGGGGCGSGGAGNRWQWMRPRPQQLHLQEKLLPLYPCCRWAFLQQSSQPWTWPCPLATLAAVAALLEQIFDSGEGCVRCAKPPWMMNVVGMRARLPIFCLLGMGWPMLRGHDQQRHGFGSRRLWRRCRGHRGRWVYGGFLPRVAPRSTPRRCW